MTADQPLTEGMLDRLAVLATLHDVGKANLGFQDKVFDPGAPRAGHVRELAPLLDPYALDSALHQRFVTALPHGVETWFADGEMAYSYLMATFSHHGRPVQFKGEHSGTYWPARNAWWLPQEDRDPFQAVATVSAWAREVFPGAFEAGNPLPAHSRFHHVYAGLLILADWLGSHPAVFPVENVDVAQRIRDDREAIPRLLRLVGLDAQSSQKDLVPADFETRFGFMPRPLQSFLDTLKLDKPGARLVIAESETGSGKTEAALHWFARLFAAEQVDGLYFALPTRVAARGLYDRVTRAVERWFPDPAYRPLSVLAVPGYVQVDRTLLNRALPDEVSANRSQDDTDLAQAERQWAAERPKRFLAATVAVGTVDQALLSVVRTAHAHLRSACLDRSLLVVDEVHASDAYMSGLLRSLLEHHLAVGGWAMLLSATLGACARTAFKTAAGTGAPAPTLAEAVSAPYPAVTLLGGQPTAVGIDGGQGRSVRFELVPLAFRPERVLDEVDAALRRGGRVVAVLNTVGRANAFLRAAEERGDLPSGCLFSVEGVACPHHGRFAPQDRLALDREVSLRLGPGSAPGPLLLVGTQTLEQSLDIDADLLVTDLAPADVLLQRVGRLHRHKRSRPQGLTDARCLVLVPEGGLDSALDSHGKVASSYRALGYGSVYEDLRVLELTRRLLVERPDIRVPEDNRHLVEGVTHPERLASFDGRTWALHAQTVDGSDLARAIAAGHAVAPFDEYFGAFEFTDVGERVAIRLGGGNLQLPVDRPFRSPFGQVVEEVVIPRHLAPQEKIEQVVVETEGPGGTVLGAGERRYTYGRFGLEVESA